MGPGSAGHETHPVQTVLSKGTPPSSFCLLLVVFSLLFFILCPDFMGICMKIDPTIRPLLKVEPPAFYNPSVMVNMGHVF